MRQIVSTNYIAFQFDNTGAHGTPRPTSRNVWTVVTSVPLFARTKIIHCSKSSARTKAPLKPAHSRHFVRFGSRGELWADLNTSSDKIFARRWSTGAWVKTRLPQRSTGR